MGVDEGVDGVQLGEAEGVEHAAARLGGNADHPVYGAHRKRGRRSGRLRKQQKKAEKALLASHKNKFSDLCPVGVKCLHLSTDAAHDAVYPVVEPADSHTTRGFSATLLQKKRSAPEQADMAAETLLARQDTVVVSIRIPSLASRCRYT